MSVPPGFVYTPRGAFAFNAARNCATSALWRIPAPLYNFGERMFCSGAALGDTLDMYLVDHDNILNGGADAIIAHTVRGLFAIPDHLVENDNPVIMNPLQTGLYLKVVYTSCTTGLTPVGVIINLRSYEQGSDFVNDSG